ncbi:MAG: DivIVA domain-containing protein [Candidatus Geothermincolales bacterium]
MKVAITPMDIHLKEFRTVPAGGYDKEEVDSFLDMVADELEKAQNRVKELEESLEAMKAKVLHYEDMQQTLQTALTSAQKSAGDILQEARNQAAAIIKRAQERSERILQEMRKEKESILSSFFSLRDQIVGQIPQMKEVMEKGFALIQELETQAKKALLRDMEREILSAPEPEAPKAKEEVAEVETKEEEKAEEKPVEEKTIW